jgi:hypothetical protein
MRFARLLFLLAVLLAPAFTAPVAGRANADDIIDRMNKAETEVLQRIRTSQPLMEVYVQTLAPDEARGWVPTEDNYFLGQLQFDKAPSLRPFGRKPQRGVMLRLITSPPNVGNAFAAMVAPDWRGLDRKRYELKYVRREFLGESRCFVFDVRPLRDASTAPAAGRKRQSRVCSRKRSHLTWTAGA